MCSDDPDIFPVSRAIRHVQKKNTSNFIDCHLKKGYLILIIFGTIISGTTGHQMTLQCSISLKARCTNVVQLWTRVKSKFEPSSAVNSIAPKRFKRWSPFNSELPSDHRSNFDLGSTCGYACTLGNKCSPGYYWCKKIVWFESYPAQKKLCIKL